MAVDAPTSDLDLFTDDALLDPYPLYAELRAAGPAVWLPRIDAYAVPRYQELRTAGRNWQIFSARRGVMLNDTINSAVAGKVTLCCDPPEHGQMRGVLRRPLTGPALAEVEPVFYQEARQLVERLVERGTFDGVSDLARHLPLQVVSNLVGIPDEGREQMLEWAFATFDGMGPPSPRTQTSVETSLGMIEYALTRAVPPRLAPGGWAQHLYDAAARGELAPEQAPLMLLDYLGPSLDTTINATTNALWLFARHPDQWKMVRQDPSLIPNAINESLRLESPIQHFSRYVTQDVDMGGTRVPADSRVVLLFGSANRDERRWERPETFDVRRNRVGEHVAFGHGPHACVGAQLARLELKALFESLAERVTGFELGNVVRASNQTLRGFATLELTVV